MRTKDYDPHGGHVIMAVTRFWDEGLIQWLPCWWWGTLKKLQLPQCGGWFVGLFVVQMASMKIKIRYDGLHRPSKKHKTTPLKTTSQNYKTFNERSDSFVEKKKKKSIWTTTKQRARRVRRHRHIEEGPVFRSLRGAIRSFPCRDQRGRGLRGFLWKSIPPKKRWKKYLQNDNRKSPSFNIFSTVVVHTSSFMLHAYLFISVILVFAGVMAQSFFWSSERSRTK